MRGQRRTDGNNVLYHYLQKDLQVEDVFLFHMLASRLVNALGIWFAPEIYAVLPIILPFVVRDPTCREKAPGANEDSWGAANADGYFRDDNSLVKGLPKSLAIDSPRPDVYRGSQIGNGFVASHVWRELDSQQAQGSLASHNPWVNTFVPNMVWLPSQVSKLTDREGSFTQSYLQAHAFSLFRALKPHPDVAAYVERSWELLSEPRGIPEQSLPSPVEVNYFTPTKRWINTRLAKNRLVAESLKLVALSERPFGKVISSRYTNSLQALNGEAAARLGEELIEYCDRTENAVAEVLRL